MFFLKITCKLWEQLPQGQWPSQTAAFLLSDKDGMLMSDVWWTSLTIFFSEERLIYSVLTSPMFVLLVLSCCSTFEVYVIAYIQ